MFCSFLQLDVRAHTGRGWLQPTTANMAESEVLMVLANMPIRYRGGLRKRRGNVTWPFATLIADSSRIDLASLIGGLTVHRSSQVFITPRDGLTARGLRFYAEGASSPVTFWTGRRDELREQLEMLGWVVEDVQHPK